MKRFILPIIVLIIIFTTLALTSKRQYAVSVMPTVIYNTENIFSAYDITNNELSCRDKSGLVREIEGQTFPGTVWTIHETISINGVDVYKATTNEYWNIPNGFYFYIDSRAVQLVNKKPEPRNVVMPQKEELMLRLRSIQKQTEEELIPYIWGGNTLEGISQHEDFYGNGSNLSKLSPEDEKQFFLKGLDCTGLIYYITDGATPRNSSWLRTYGEGLKIENKSIDEVIEMTESLDIIVHQGHALMVLDDEYTIESRLSEGGGVVITPIRERFEELFETKIPLNDAPQGRSESSWFVIRRFVE